PAPARPRVGQPASGPNIHPPEEAVSEARCHLQQLAMGDVERGVGAGGRACYDVDGHGARIADQRTLETVLREIFTIGTIPPVRSPRILTGGTSMVATLPLAAGTWAFDPNHSGVNFKVRPLGLTNVHGRFNGVDAWLKVGDDLSATS